MTAQQDVIARAFALKGTRYQVGAESPSATDCSGLVYQCFRDTGNGALVGTSRKLAAGYARYFANLGRYSHSLSDAEPGDLICYTHGTPHISHIAIYLGNGRIISALTTTGVTETHYNTISVTFNGVCMVNWNDSRSGTGDPGPDGPDDPGDPTDPDFNNQPPTIPDTEANIGYTPNMSGQWSVPIRRMQITFPTPTDAKFELTMGYVFDQGFMGLDPYPTPPTTPPVGPPDAPWLTEDIPVVTPTPGFAGEPGPGGDWPINFGLHYFIRRGEYGQESGGGGGVYSSVGIEHGFAANIPWTQANCGGPILGPGAWNKWEDCEFWVDLQLDDFDRAQIRANGVDYLATWGANTLVQGYVPSISVRIAHVDPAAGLYGVGDTIGTLGSSSPDFDDHQIISTRTATMGSLVIPWTALVEGEKSYLVVSPGWECERGAYFCDPFYTGGPLACIAQGPRCSGQGQSGVYVLNTGGGPSSLVAMAPRAGVPTTGAIWVGTSGDGTQYRTQHPYVPGTLSVTYEGQQLRKGIDVIETDPASGIFTLAKDLRDNTESITVRYQPADWTYTPSPDATLPPGGTGAPFIPPPSNPYGTTYRPANQRQFGWGTIYDSTNCNMACAAMALDRHTLGRYTKTRTDFPYPYNTPPNMRSESGSTSLNGTGQDDTQRAWTNGWAQTWAYPGPSAWETAVSQIASGRGATFFGRYAYMDTRYKKSRTYDGPHAIYVNEQLADGSFWGFDPIVGYPINWPYDVLKTYAESYLGFNGRVVAGFTQVTPKI